MFFENPPVPIPPEREAAFLAHAEVAANEAAEPVVKERGGYVISAAEDALIDYTPGGPVDQAEALIKADAKALALVEQATAYVRTHDLSKTFMDTVTKPISSVADEANGVLAEYNSLRARLADNTPYSKLSNYQKPHKPIRYDTHPTPENLVIGGLIKATRQGQEQAGRLDITPPVINEALYDLVSGNSWRRPDTKVEE
jgi:hypothetical protein